MIGLAAGFTGFEAAVVTVSVAIFAFVCLLSLFRGPRGPII